MTQLYTIKAEQGAYQFGYAFVEYAVSEYGWEDFLEFYKKPGIQANFGVDDETFRENWINYLIETYGIFD
jgi:hypothetical protein